MPDRRMDGQTDERTNAVTLLRDDSF